VTEVVLKILNMEQVPGPYVDERLTGACVYCGGPPPLTRDHVPPKAFLDEPYPENLPVVECCRECNEGASLDEEYVSCLLEVAATGSAQPSGVQRPKIRRKLAESPALSRRLAESLGDGIVVAETSRVRRIVEKMGRALWSFEIGEPTFGMDARVTMSPISSLTAETLDSFMAVRQPHILPEVGSRAMFRTLVLDGAAAEHTWLNVQDGRFEYVVEWTGSPVGVKMIVRDYLAAQVELE